MMRFRLMLLTAGLIGLQLAGCAMVESPRVAMRRMTRQFTPNPVDSGDDSDKDKGEWDFVGDEGRADYHRELDPIRGGERSSSRKKPDQLNAIAAWITDCRYAVPGFARFSRFFELTHSRAPL